MLSNAPRFGFTLLLCFLMVESIPAETGAEAWLRYAPVANASNDRLPRRIVVTGSDAISQNAGVELARGLRSEIGIDAQISTVLPNESAFILGTFAGLASIFPANETSSQNPDSFQIKHERQASRELWIIEGKTPVAELYAVFHLLRLIATDHTIENVSDAPSSSVRWVDQWDNLDGSIERGYAGRSIFFDQGHVRIDMTRASDYARLLASVGINGCTVNNVNADLRILTPETLHEIAHIADAFPTVGSAVISVGRSLESKSGRRPSNL